MYYSSGGCSVRDHTFRHGRFRRGCRVKFHHPSIRGARPEHQRSIIGLVSCSDPEARASFDMVMVFATQWRQRLQCLLSYMYYYWCRKEPDLTTKRRGRQTHHVVTDGKALLVQSLHLGQVSRLHWPQLHPPLGSDHAMDNRPVWFLSVVVAIGTSMGYNYLLVLGCAVVGVHFKRRRKLGFTGNAEQGVDPVCAC